MKVTKAQAQANRAHVVETASALFRERGYDGVGVADLMAAAGFTHGGFYRQFGSKTELMAESAACGIAQTAALTAGVNTPEFVRIYLSREHRDARASGCTMAALGGDAARQSEEVRATFAAGIESLLAALNPEGLPSDCPASAQERTKSLDILTRAVGAIVVSRACPDDSQLADEILDVCRNQILASLAPSPSPAAKARHPARRRGNGTSPKPG
ncbi:MULTISPECIES: TetR/AcrR family transcriptional regulator [unclassified Variovorax]|uniref:TetR/AcrR family transcriptional regulator n=1 Tax=unclassified Variovorax TaxID=663243 RepID=UPI0025760A22|nr:MULTISPECIES: TetR/AcrR family transcriptional regulator [unclassified Variovorax]MDM0087980.1 TetR/AcrR family transcriptional regulator [Variovorax sp. J22G40]MDM0146053.1 TetR/AcrR family transcriptional regulator [Variovorax sp. J2P1-31]